MKFNLLVQPRVWRRFGDLRPQRFDRRGPQRLRTLGHRLFMEAHSPRHQGMHRAPLLILARNLRQRGRSHVMKRLALALLRLPSALLTSSAKDPKKCAERTAAFIRLLEHRGDQPVSYTHLRAHETDSYL